MTSIAMSRPFRGANIFSRLGVKQILAAFVALATISATMTIAMTEAEAGHRRGRTAAIIGAGILGAVALGAIASQANRGRAYEDDGYYYQPRPRYHRPRHARPVYDDGYYVQRRPICRIRTVRTYDDYGNIYRQRVRVCR
jgi:hypothetical protein